MRARDAIEFISLSMQQLMANFFTIIIGARRARDLHNRKFLILSQFHTFIITSFLYFF